LRVGRLSTSSWLQQVTARAIHVTLFLEWRRRCHRFSATRRVRGSTKAMSANVMLALFFTSREVAAAMGKLTIATSLCGPTSAVQPSSP